MQNQLVTKRKLKSSIVQYALLTLAILLVGGYFGYVHYTEYQATKEAFDQENILISQLKGSADKSKKDYLELKKSLDTQNSGLNDSIEKIMPSGEDFTNLARELDKYFLNTKTGLNPMFLSDLRFNPPVVKATEDYGTLPFSMTFSGNEAGLTEFLNYVENSGDLNNKTRLLDIDTFNLNYENDTNTAPAYDENGAVITDSSSTTTPVSPEDRSITATMNLNAFYQKPVDAVQQ